MKTANVHQAKTNLSRLLTAAADGDEVIITRRGGAVTRFRLVPVVQLPMSGKLYGAYQDKITLAPDYDTADREISELFDESARQPL